MAGRRDNDDAADDAADDADRDRAAGSAKTPARVARQAQALRANLARRKAQAKGRGGAPMAPIKNPERTGEPDPD